MSNIIINPYQFGELWTPAKTTTALWLDASDTNSITLNGSNVSQWDDKSGNNNHATQVIAGDQPEYTGVQNSLNVITFDGADEGFDLTSEISGTSISFFAVCKGYGYLTARTTTDRIVYSSANLFYWEQNDSFIFTGTTPSQHNTSSYQLNEYNVNVGVNSRSIINAVQDQGTASNAVTKFDRIGLKFDEATGLPSWTGTIAEIVVIIGSISDDLRDNIEGYFAHKWGIEGDLPGDHPYKNAAPTV